MVPMNKLDLQFSSIVTFILLTLAIIACHKKESNQITNNEYVTVTEADISTCVKTVFPKEQIVALKTNAGQRKKIIENLKSTFAVARAAQEAGFEQSDEYQKHLSSGVARLLATEFSERNANYQIKNSDIELYASKHKNDFDSELDFLNYHPENSQDIDKAKLKWSELHLRAEMGRQKGLDKEEAFQHKYRLLRADILANMILKNIEEQYKVKDSDIKTYYSQHPETNPENIKQKMYRLISRIKGGDSFEQIAGEINEDDTKEKGGDLGWFSFGTMAPELEKVAFSLQKNLFCLDPVETEYGYHIVLLIGRRKSSTTGKDEVHVKHIFLNTNKAKEVLTKQMKANIERDIEAVKAKHPVNTPLDFTVD